MAQLDQTTINRYSQGGDVYVEVANQYGMAGADQIAAAAQTGDGAALANAIEIVRRNGPALNTSTLSIFGNQLLTDPLAAPFESANNVIGNSFLSLLKNPWVLGAIALGLFFFFGGASIIRAWVRSKAK